MAMQRATDYFVDDEYILSQPVSRRRERQLLDQYLDARQRTRTAEVMFDRVGAFQMKSRPSPSNVRDFGFKTVVFKRSFVDGVNSAIVSAHDWAEGQEDFLLRYLDERLREAVAGRLGAAVERDLAAILLALDEMASALRDRGFEATLFVRSGQFGQRLYDDLLHAIQSRHEWYSMWKSAEPRAVYRLVGAYAGIPILDIPDSPTPAMYAVDLARFATLTRFGNGPRFEPDFDVKEFKDDKETRDLLVRQPRLILNPAPGPGQDEERIRQLRLRVGLELWETYELKMKERASEAVISRPLVGPPIDY